MNIIKVGSTFINMDTVTAIKTVNDEVTVFFDYMPEAACLMFRGEQAEQLRAWLTIVATDTSKFTDDLL